jgi:polysaccharide export outer membrane protein
MRILLITTAACTALSCLVGPVGAVPQGDSGAEEAKPEYRIGSEDILAVQVWGNAELNGQVEVDESGMVKLPVVGEVPVAGRTTDELSETLTARYRLFDPTITEVIVTVAQYNAFSVSIVGEVRNPGRFGFREKPDLWSALLRAGGTTPQADLAMVQVVHEDTLHTGERTQTVDLSSGIEDTDPGVIPRLRTKDTIVVPSLVEQRGVGENVRVLGAVRNPGAYRISSAPTTVEMLALSGGPLTSADLGQVRLTRKTKTGSVTFRLDLDGYLTGARPEADLPLQAEDILMIPEGKPVFEKVVGDMIRATPLLTVVISVIGLVSR